ncbi:MAG: hypothetical protein AVDCRST_MAG54-1766, partial [uncultured Actinomycetospora sp.]
APHLSLARRRRHRGREHGAALPAPPPGHPPRPLAARDDRRAPVVHPATLDRPRPAIPPRRTTPRPPL